MEAPSLAPDPVVDSHAAVLDHLARRGGWVLLDLRNLSAGWVEDDLSSRTVADRIALVQATRRHTTVS